MKVNVIYKIAIFLLQPPAEWHSDAMRKTYVVLWPVAAPIRWIAIPIFWGFYGAGALGMIGLRRLLDHLEKVWKGHHRDYAE